MLINVGVCGCPADDGAVVLELAREGKLLAGLAGRASPLAVVEYDSGEAFVVKPPRERSESAGLDRADAVCHHHGWVRPVLFGQVKSSLQLVTGSRGNPHRGAGRDGGIVARGLTLTTAELVTELRSSRTDLARIVEAVDRSKRSMLVVPAQSVRAWEQREPRSWARVREWLETNSITLREV